MVSVILNCPCGYYDHFNEFKDFDTVTTEARRIGWHYVKILKVRMCVAVPYTAKGQCKECFELELEDSR